MLFEDFIAFFDECNLRGKCLCLESQNLGKDNWPSVRFIEYLAGIEKHKNETGAITRYATFMVDDEIIEVDIYVRVPAFKDDEEKEYCMCWVVRDKETGTKSRD